jgi:hypothetical protein
MQYPAESTEVSVVVVLVEAVLALLSSLALNGNSLLLLMG